MDIKDFTEKEQEMIKKGLTFSKLNDKETADKIIALIPQDMIKRIPFFVRKHAITRTVKRVSLEYPELYAVAEQEGQGSSRIATNSYRYFPRENEQA